MATIEESVAQAMNAAARAMSSASDAATSAQQSKTWATAQLNQVAFGGSYKDLTITVSGTGYQGSIQCSRLVLEGYDGITTLLKGVSVSFDAASVGANGLDTGIVSAGNWYYLYVITNGTTISSLVSLSSTNPALPAGYTRFALVGCARVVAATTNFVASFQKNNSVRYGTATVGASINVLSVGAATTNTDVPLTNAIPPLASGVRFIVSGHTGGGTTLFDSSGLQLTNLFGQSYYPYTLEVRGPDVQKITYKVSSSGTPTNIYVTGYFL